MSDLINAIGSDYGLIGLFLAVSLTMNGILFKLLLVEKDKRIEDAQNILNGVATSLTFIKDSLQLIDDKIRVARRAEYDERN